MCQEKDSKNPTRWRRVVQCRIANRPGQGFKEFILDLCDKRKDSLGEDVRTRLLGACSDLHAADGQYHKDCYDNFLVHQFLTHSRD